MRHLIRVIPILFFVGCTSNLSKVLSGPGITVTAPPSASGTGTDGTAAFKLSRVVLDTSSSTPATLALIGDGSNNLGSLCQAGTTNANNGTPSTVSSTSSLCFCSFFYSTASTPNLQVDIPISYAEQNLVRCSYAAIPASVTSFNIAIHATSNDTFSNKINFNLATAGISFDSSNPKNFVLPTRFQCRDIQTIPYMLDVGSGMYDPFQSEDAHLTYPLDFYTTNLGLSAEALVDGFTNLPGLQNWNCPSVLNPNLYLTGDSNNSASPISQYISTNQVNLTIYSKAPLGSNSIIYPASGPVDRSTFYLAKKQGGIFTVPVNGFMAPLINTSTTQFTTFAKAPLGYGAPPVPVGIGTGSETCPDSSITIPANFHWMKLWLFRSTLPQRNSQASGRMLSQVTGIVCNPGDWPVASSPTVYSPIYTGCYLEKTHASAGDVTQDWYSLALKNVDPTGKTQVNGKTIFLADRWINASVCSRLQSPGRSDTCFSSNGVFPGPGCNGYDVWEAELPYAHNSTTYPNAQQVGCGSNNLKPVTDPLNLCSVQNPAFTTDTATGRAGTGQGTNPTILVPNDIVTTNLDVGGSRFDYLFVVSPPGVTTANMQLGSSIALPYQPMRFKLASDCTFADPSNPACLSGNLLSYDMKQHDVGTNGDPPADNPKSPVAFPVCVLQPN